MLELVQGGIATIDDHSACKEALGKLHALGLKHGNIWCNNFIVKNGKATMIDFEETCLLWDESVLAQEMQDLEWALTDGGDPDNDDD